jgi:hypothetical protein
MKNYKVTYEVKDGLIRRKTYTFNETIISNNPKEAFKEAKNFCKKSSRYLLYIIPVEKWSIKEIIEE